MKAPTVRVVMLMGFGLWSVTAVAQQGARAGGEVGQELRKLGKEVLQAPKEVAPKGEKPAIKVKEEAAPAGKGAEGEKAPGATYKISSLNVVGDVEEFERLGLRERMAAETVGQTVTKERIDQLAREYQAMLVEKGYSLARVWAPAMDWSKGVLVYRIDMGRVGRIALYSGSGKEREPYRGRYYAEDQVKRRLYAVEEGAVFDYGRLYSSLYNLNAHPDLTADVDIHVRKEGSGDEQRRVADLDVEVRERLPIHGVLQFDNAGTDLTDEWGVGLTLQHLNLTRHDDVLTISAPVSLDLESIRSVGGSYYLPYHMGNGGGVSAFGGYSKLESESVVPEVNLDGKGWFSGLQLGYNVLDDGQRRVTLGVGVSHSVVEDSLLLEDMTVNPREVDLSPVQAVVDYSTLEPDSLGGRNGLTLVGSAHWGDFMGSSDDEEFAMQRLGAPADYVVGRVRGSRVQPLGARGVAESRQWVLFGRVSGQGTTEPLIPAEQMGMGGYDTVRGYREREFLGDQGVSGSVELRTPIVKGLMGEDRVQGVLFTDGGYVDSKEAWEGEVVESESLYSVGVGVRYSVATHAQARLDWGFPLKDTDESESSGYGHVAVQVMF